MSPRVFESHPIKIDFHQEEADSQAHQLNHTDDDECVIQVLRQRVNTVRRQHEEGDPNTDDQQEDDSHADQKRQDALFGEGRFQ